MQAFNYKPALLGARCDVRVSPDGVEMSRGSKTQAVRPSEVTGVRLVEVSARTSSTSLVLLHAGGKFALQYGGRVDAAHHDKDAAEFVRACVAILEAVAAAKQDMDDSFGGAIGLRSTMAGLGVAMGLMGLLIAVIPFSEGPVDGEGIVTVLMALGIALGGFALAATYNPFRKPPALKASDAAEVLRAHLPAG